MLSKRFGIGESPNDARLQFDARKQETGEKLDTFLDHLEALRIKAAPGESIKTRHLEIMRNFMTGLLDEELQQSLFTSYTGEYYTDNPPTVEQIRSKCHDYLTLRRVNRRKGQNEQPSQNAKTTMPANWTTPDVSQAKTLTSQNANFGHGQQHVQINNQSQNRNNEKGAPFDRSKYACFACGELGHVAKNCSGYRKSLCRMGYGPPPELNDPDELSKFYKAIIRMAPIHCFTAWKRAI